MNRKLTPADSVVIESMMPLDYQGHPKHDHSQVHWYAGVTNDPLNPQVRGPLWSPYFEDAEAFGSSTHLSPDGRVMHTTAEEKATWIISNIIQLGGCTISSIKDARIGESIQPLKKKKWWKVR